MDVDSPALPSQNGSNPASPHTNPTLDNDNSTNQGSGDEGGYKWSDPEDSPSANFGLEEHFDEDGTSAAVPDPLKSPSSDESGDNDNDNEEEDEESSEEEDEDEQIEGLSTSEREILTLLAVDQKLASVLDLAATALSSLRPNIPADGNSQEAKEPLKLFKEHAGEYYKVVDDIQLTLRSSIHQVRKARIPPGILQDPQNNLKSVLRGPIAPGTLEEDDKHGLSLSGMRMEREVWKEVVKCLEHFKSSRASVP